MGRGSASENASSQKLLFGPRQKGARPASAEQFYDNLQTAAWAKVTPHLADNLITRELGQLLEPFVSSCLKQAQADKRYVQRMNQLLGEDIAKANNTAHYPNQGFYDLASCQTKAQSLAQQIANKKKITTIETARNWLNQALSWDVACETANYISREGDWALERFFSEVEWDEFETYLEERQPVIPPTPFVPVKVVDRIEHFDLTNIFWKAFKESPEPSREAISAKFLDWARQG